MADVVRLLFTYDGTDVRLVEQSLVQMKPPAAAITDHPGTYVDLRTADGQPLARTKARGALATHQEVFPEPPDQKIQRIPGANRGAFVVTLPVVEGVDHIAVVQVQGHPLDRSMTPASTTLAQFPWGPHGRR